MSRHRWYGAHLVLATLALLLIGAPLPLAGQVLRGRVMDATTEAPIQGATMALLDDDSARVVATAATDSVGYFLVAAEAAGAYRLRAQRIGYPTTTSTPLRVSTGDTLEVEFRVSAAAVLLDPVVVTARRRPPPPIIVDFYERAQRSIFGTFITRAEVEELHPIRTTDLLRRIPGVQVVPLYLGGGSAVLMRGGCRPRVVVDGVRVRDVRSIDDLVQPLELEGLEVYRSSSQVPVQYGGLGVPGECGAVIIWTRRGD
jgi:hypothetical protein